MNVEEPVNKKDLFAKAIVTENGIAFFDKEQEDEEGADPEQPVRKGRKRGRKELYINPVMLEEMAASGASVQEMARALGISRMGLYRKMSVNPEVLETIERGRAKAVTLIGHVLKNKALKGDVKCAELYLRKFGDNWKDKEIQVNHTGSLEVKNTVDDATLTRAAAAYLQMRG